MQSHYIVNVTQVAMRKTPHSSVLDAIPGSISPLIAFSTSLEVSVIKMKHAPPVPVHTAVNLKAKSRHNFAVIMYNYNIIAKATGTFDRTPYCSVC